MVEYPLSDSLRPEVLKTGFFRFQKICEYILLSFGSCISLKGPMCQRLGLLPLVLLRDGGTFERWGLM
jgi:hypothetical protein